MDYWAKLKAADKALGVDDLQHACDALLAQTETVTVPVLASDVRIELWRSGDFGKLDHLYQAGCRGDYSGYPVPPGYTSNDVFSVISTTMSVINSNIVISIDADWQTVLMQVGLLSGLSLISDKTSAAIMALRTTVAQVWPDLTPGLLQQARMSN